MNLDRWRPVYVFDTSALIQFALPRSPGHAALLARLDQQGQYFYHPITLSELAEYVHEPIVRERRRSLSPTQVADFICTRRLPLTSLHTQRKQDDSRTNLHGRRFLPGATSFEWFSYLAHQRSRLRNLCQSADNQLTVVAALTDHQILALAGWLQRSRYQVTFVSGDQRQLAAAAYLAVPWIYSHDPSRVPCFAWAAP